MFVKLWEREEIGLLGIFHCFFLWLFVGLVEETIIIFDM